MSDQSESTNLRHRGRPLKFEAVEDLQSAVDKYFEECDSRKVDFVTKDGQVVQITKRAPYTISGLALALDTSRETLLDYQERPDFSDTIKKAKDKCLKWTEDQLFEGKGQSAGVIFNLKNNYAWRDKTETESTVVADITSNGETIVDPILAAGYAEYLRTATSQQA